MSGLGANVVTHSKEDDDEHIVPRALLSLEVVTIKTKGWVFALGP